MAKTKPQGLNMAALKGLQKDIGKAAGSGGDLFFYSSKIPEALDVRLLPPPDEANGIYFLEQRKWWIDGTNYLCNSTPIIGGKNVIQDEIDAARKMAAGDKDLAALLDARKSNGAPVLKLETSYLIPMLILDIEEDSKGDITAINVVDDTAKILIAKPTLMLAINAIVTARPYQNKTLHGLMDREKGYNIILGKSGTGKKTAYTAMGWNEMEEMDEKYYEEGKIPNVFELTRKSQKSDIHLQSVIRNYLYGEEIIEDTETPPADTKPVAAEKLANTPAKKRSRPNVAKSAPITDDNAGSSRNILDDAEAAADELDAEAAADELDAEDFD